MADPDAGPHFAAPGGERGKALAAVRRLVIALVGPVTSVLLEGTDIPAMEAAVTGTALQQTVEAVDHQIERGLLAPRETLRVGMAANDALEKILIRRQQGDEIRTDWFEASGEGARTASAEVLEGTLRKAAASYEEQKVPFVGSLFANLAFSPDVSIPDAHHFLHIAETLTFRQFVLLHVFDAEVHQDDVDLIARGLTELRQIDLPGITPGVKAEIMGLANEGLLGIAQEGGEVVHPSATIGGGLITEQVLERIRPTDRGHLLAELMALSEMPPADVEEVLAGLAGDREWRNLLT